MEPKTFFRLIFLSHRRFHHLSILVNGWNFKVFTKGRKNVIIKSVVTVLPNHVMSCFRIPKTVMKKLTSLVTQFWWRPGEIPEIWIR
ncbi:unnamed protein product, partial [Brassica rapa subsp. narinosa]